MRTGRLRIPSRAWDGRARHVPGLEMVCVVVSDESLMGLQVAFWFLTQKAYMMLPASVLLFFSLLRK
jgi:hypothetical protein